MVWWSVGGWWNEVRCAECVKLGAAVVASFRVLWQFLCAVTCILY